VELNHPFSLFLSALVLLASSRQIAAKSPHELAWTEALAIPGDIASLEIEGIDQFLLQQDKPIQEQAGWSLVA
jgi:hypothetical protein